MSAGKNAKGVWYGEGDGAFRYETGATLVIEQAGNGFAYEVINIDGVVVCHGFSLDDVGLTLEQAKAAAEKAYKGAVEQGVL